MEAAPVIGSYESYFFPFLSSIFETSLFLFHFYTAYLEGTNNLNQDLMGLHCIYMGSAALQFKRNDFFFFLTDVYSHPILPPPVSVLRLSPLVKLWPLIGSCTCHSAFQESHLLLDEPAQVAKISQRKN